MRSLFVFSIACVFLALTCVISPACVWSQAEDPHDSFSSSYRNSNDPLPFSAQTPAELVEEAQLLLDEERPLDARTKLLEALKKDPTFYRAHILLSGYYLVHVGHFRLALRYIKQAIKLFEEQHGPPPYSQILHKAQHAQLLHLLSQTRLNLDDYQGALHALDEYSSYGYLQEWYPGSRAWILMKLGRLDEAIQTARLGLLSGAEAGRTLNILGILLSMRGDRERSIQVFRDAIAYEFSLGNTGQPATPLNNIGEVFKETFQEDQAESSWRKATSLPDGCEHVLPSLNLTFLYIEQNNLRQASRTLDNFESCIAQFPLRNGEEHRALVHLARGRIALHSGDIAEAIRHLERASQKQQWFGKIGTDIEDLQAATLQSLGQAYASKAAHLHSTPPTSFLERIKLLQERIISQLKSWWYFRRSRQVLIEDLRGFEDLFIRNTDSMLEYPTLGDLLESIPVDTLQKRLQKEKAQDKRKLADLYYDLYEAQNLIAHRQEESRAQKLLRKILREARPRIDSAVKLHALALSLRLLEENSAAYRSTLYEIFRADPARLRNRGYPLPVRVEGSAQKALPYLSDSMFLPTDSPTPCSLAGGESNQSVEIALHCRGENKMPRQVSGRGESFPLAIQALTEKVFTRATKKDGFS